MAKLTKEELLKKANAFIGDQATDEGVSLLEDIADTIEDTTDISEYVKKIEELEQKVSDTENTWREKYRARFLDSTPDTKPEPVKEEADNGANDDDIEPPSFEEIAAMF